MDDSGESAGAKAASRSVKGPHVNTPDMAAADVERLGALLDEAGLAEPSSQPRIGIVGGSGLSGVAEEMEGCASLGFGELAGLGAGQVEGHAGKWIVGRLGGTPVHFLAGRRHLYEGIEPAAAIGGIRLLAQLGTRLVILTNAAGGLSPKFSAGDLMLIRDQIIFSFRNPLIGPNSEEIGPRFPDMSEPYDGAAQAFVRKAAQRAGVRLQEGVYAQLLGPTYESRAEIAMLRRLGAHAVGMSTAPETLAARHAGLRVIGISLITNECLVDGSPPAATTHEEVLQVAGEARERLVRLLAEALPGLARLTLSPVYAA
jgi:purine-nucleoside phosphorylase